MAQELTNGFDLEAHISEDAIERVFQSYYWLGNFPSHAEHPFVSAGEQHSLEIFFHQPALRFVEEPGMDNAVRLSFQFLVRLSNQDEEHTGTARLVLSATRLSTPDGQHGLGIAFASVGPGEFDFSLDSNYPEWQDIVRPLVLSNLLSTAENVWLSPPSGIDLGALVWRTYPNASPRFAAAFVDLGGNAGSAPPTVSPYITSPDRDIRFGMPVERVNQHINSELAKNGLADLPTDIEHDGDTYTVEALSIELKDHYLYITGTIDDADFKAWANLSISGGAIQVGVTSLDIDLPWYLDILDVFTAGTISRIVEDTLPGALEAIGGGSLSGLGIFASAVPGSDLVVDIQTGGAIHTSAQGLLIGGSVTPVFDALPTVKPTYIWGNKDTKEFHRRPCPYGDKLKWQRTVLFISEEAAIRDGFNGCWTCAREYSHPAGRLSVGIQSFDGTPNEQREVEVALRGFLTEPIVVDGVEVTNPPFALDFKRKIKADESGHWSFISHQGLLVPGNWRIKVKLEDWEGECTMRIKPTATNFGASNKMAFTVGKSEGNSGYDEMPDFP